MKNDLIKLLEKASAILLGEKDVESLIGGVLLAPCLIIWWLLLYAIS